MKETPLILITRELQHPELLDMPFWKDYHVLDEYLIDFAAEDFKIERSYDWIFFSSRNGVKFFFEHEERKKLSEAKIACMGVGTAEEVVELFGKYDFVGTGNPIDTAAEFSKLLDDHQSVLFPLAESSKKSVQKHLASSIDLGELIVYTNRIKQDVSIPKVDLVAFTSPMSVDAFNANYEFEGLPYAVAIGQSTAEQLAKHGFVDIFISERASEEGMLEKLGEIIARLFKEN